MSATAAAAPVFKPISMANGSLTCLSTLFSPKTPCPFLSIPSKPVKTLNVSFSSSSSIPSWVSLKSKLPSSSRSLIALVARTSDWARQDEENEIDEAGLDWKQQQDGETEARVSDWEGEGEEDEQTESSAEENTVEEDSYSLPPEEAKLFVGNLPYDMESADLAELFNKAGIVETAEVIYNRGSDQSRGFGFVTMSTVEEAEKPWRMAMMMMWIYLVKRRRRGRSPVPPFVRTTVRKRENALFPVRALFQP